MPLVWDPMGTYVIEYFPLHLVREVKDGQGLGRGLQSRYGIGSHSERSSDGRAVERAARKLAMGRREGGCTAKGA